MLNSVTNRLLTVKGAIFQTAPSIVRKPVPLRYPGCSPSGKVNECPMPARIHHIALIGVFIGLLGCDRFMESAPAFDIALHGPQLEGDSIEVSGSGSDVVFSVRSEFGIGRATIRPLDGNWPTKISFRLDLKGLESFQVTGQQVFRREYKDDHRAGGYRVELPDGVAGSLDRSIEVSWIDFYR